MDNIFVYVGTGFSSEQNQEIAEILRIHHIATTNNIHHATVVIQPQTMEKNMTVEEMEEQLVEKSLSEVDKLIDSIHINKPQVQGTRKKSYTQANEKYKQIKQIYKQKIFNRTKHK